MATIYPKMDDDENEDFEDLSFWTEDLDDPEDEEDEIAGTEKDFWDGCITKEEYLQDLYNEIDKIFDARGID